MRLAWLAVLGACTTSAPAPVRVEFGGGDLDEVIATAVDGDGNIYLAGRSQNTVALGDVTLPGHGFTDVIVASIRPDGTLRWVQGWGGRSGDEAHGLAVDGRGHVFVSGEFMFEMQLGRFDLVDAGVGDMFLAELDAQTGDVLDARRFGTPGDDDTGRLAVDDKGEPVLCGVFGAGDLDLGGVVLSDAHDSNAFVAALDGNLNARWARVLADDGLDACTGIALDLEGNITVAGGFGGTADFGSGPITSLAGIDNLGLNGYVASYTASGEPRFAHGFLAPDGAIASSVAIGVNHRVYVGGLIEDRGFVAAFDAAGTPLWQARLTASEKSSIRDIATFYDGVWLAGARDSDALAAMITSDGSYHGEHRIGDAATDAASASSLTYDGQIVVGGSSASQGFVTILSP